MLADIENTDIYLIDQIFKGRYQNDDSVLFAGCGTGRNMAWFYNQNFNISAVDKNDETLAVVKETYPNISSIVKGNLNGLHYKNENFNHIICSAVLHFAESEKEFDVWFKELIRVLKPEGSLFIRMTTNIGVQQTIKEIGKGIYYLKDETNRFLITRKKLEKLLLQFNLELIEPFKTTVVEDLRSMATIVLKKV